MPILMNKAKEVLEFTLHRNYVATVKAINLEIAPEMLKDTNPGLLDAWFRDRSLDLTRSNARLLLKKMQLPNSKAELVIANKALNLTDTFWIKEVEGEKYSDFCIQRKSSNPYIVNTSLSGDLVQINRMYNAELTNIGSFDKAWIKENNQWYLVKKGNAKSIYAELFSYKLGKYLGLPMANYQVKDGLLYSPNFTNESKILEHYASYRYKFEKLDIDEKTVRNNLLTVGLDEQYLNILFLDAVVSNIDRHEHNYGVIKSSSTGNLIGLAPNFDNNLAFGGPSNPSSGQLKMYLTDFGIQNNQATMVKKMSMNLIHEIDKQVRMIINPVELSTQLVEEYFKGILSILCV
ncbi:MAG: hypothetical protein H7X94_12115 [Vallitaleaceae bacterium]|nr:hypothetical protein [Vallitaleaceae bacterium]